MRTVTAGEARLFLLRYQRLHSDYPLESVADIPQFIRKVGCVQYDPLQPAARNADLVLQSRVVGYTAELLDGYLYHDRCLLDGWDKNMSIWHVDDWPFFDRRRERLRAGYTARKSEFEPVRREILERLMSEEYLSSKDLKLNRKVDWFWAPATIGRAVLESMFDAGDLIIHHREGSRKFYTPPERLLDPALLQTPDPHHSETDYHDWYVRRRIASVGLLWGKPGAAFLGVPVKSAGLQAAIERLLKKGEIRALRIVGLEPVFYYPAEYEHLLRNSGSNRQAVFLAPLDNLIWDRNMTEALFGFHYRWEVYTPLSKRKYGYYVLPVLYDDRFIARFEPVLDRASNTLNIVNWWWEEGYLPTPAAEEALRDRMMHFVEFLGAENYTVSNPAVPKALYL